MRRTERKRKLMAGVFRGLLTAVLSFACLLCVMTGLLRNGRINEPLLRLLLPLSCLLAGTFGVLLSVSDRERRAVSLLLAGAIPAGCILCCGMLFTSGGASSAALWNSAAFLMPALAALIPGRKKSHGRR